jgi:hypothetical protein
MRKAPPGSTGAGAAHCRNFLQNLQAIIEMTSWFDSLNFESCQNRMILPYGLEFIEHPT